MNAYARFVVGNRWLVLAICLVITGLAGASLTRATFGTSIGDQILGDKPEYDRYQELSEVFGNDETVVVGLDDPDALTAEGQKRLRAALEKVEKLPDVARVESLLSAQRIEGDGKSLKVTAYADEALADPARVAEIKKALQADEFVGELFLSRDGQRHATIVELTVNPSRPVEELPHLVDDITAHFVAAGYAPDSIHRVGWMTAAGESMRQVAFNLSVLLPLIAVSLLICVWILFRRFWPAAISLAVAAVGVVWMVGFLTMIDPCIHGLVSLTPPVMLVVAFSDVVHLCSAYLKELEDGREKEAAILASAGEVGRACFWTSATTFVGFGSMITVPDNSSRTLGLALAFGVASALLLAVTLAPILFTFMPEPKPLRRGVTGKAQAGLDRLLDWFRNTARRWPRRVIAAFVVVAAIAGAGVPLANLEADFSNRFRDDHPLSIDNKWFEEHFAGTNSLELFVDSGEKNGLLDPERFALLNSYQERLRALPNVDSVLSLVDLVKRIHERMAPQLALKTPVPDSRELLAQYLLLFESSGGEDLDRLVDFERRKMRIGVRLGSTGAREARCRGRSIAPLSPVSAANPGAGSQVYDSRCSPGYSPPRRCSGWVPDR